MADDGKVTLRVQDGIAEIKFFHPRGNSLPGKTLDAIAEAIRGFSASNEARVIVLRSEGEKVFCGGASFEELAGLTSSEQADKFFMGFGKVIIAARDCPKFVLGRVQGKVVGGGVGLVAACDYALAMETASIRLSEFALGFGPFVISAALIRKIGVAAFSTLTIDTEWQSAEWGARHGLYNSIYDSQQSLDEAATTLAKKLAQANPDATRRIKKVLWEGTEDWNSLLPARAHLSSELVQTDFVQSAIRAVMEKSK